jgi:hypothetical protein
MNLTNTHRRKTALITGASGGIGYELAKLLARDGYDLVLVARNEAKLAQAANGLQKNSAISVKVMAQDLAVPEAPLEIYQELKREDIEITVLVNNAGFGAYGLFREMDLEGMLHMIQVNITSLTHLTKLVLGDMLPKRAGKILNVASTAAFQPGPLMAVYYATKAYVLLLSEALANELRSSGITVTALCPGPTETGFQERAAMQDSKLLRVVGVMDAETVAKLGYRGLMKGKTIVIPGLKNKILVQSVRLGPRSLVAEIVRRLHEREKDQR